MELILWRHADAEDGQDDLARQLTSRGRKQAEIMAKWLNARLPGESRVLASPAARAQQTAQALNRKIETIPSLAPGASVQEILTCTGWPGTEGKCVLVVGHQPDLGAVAAHLLGAHGSLSIKKGAVWWFSSHSRPHGKDGMLRAVIAPDWA